MNTEKHEESEVPDADNGEFIFYISDRIFQLQACGLSASSVAYFGKKVGGLNQRIEIFRAFWSKILQFLVTIEGFFRLHFFSCETCFHMF